MDNETDNSKIIGVIPPYTIAGEDFSQFNPYEKQGFKLGDSAMTNNILPEPVKQNFRPTKGKTSVAIKNQMMPLIPKGMSPSPLGNFRNIHYQDSVMSGNGPASQI